MRAVKTLWVVATFLAACADDGAPDRGSDVDSVTRALDFAAFDRSVEASIAAYNATEAGQATPMRGASAVVVSRTAVLHTRGYGAYPAGRLYLIASSSKILSAGVLVHLADQGLLDLDAPISRVLAGAWGASRAGDVTPAQLVSNSSGLPTLVEVSGALINPFSPLANDVCQFFPSTSLQTCGRALYATPPPRAPDTMFGYGGSAWQLAGAVAEVASQKSWRQLIQETYVEPCDVRSLGYTNQFASSALGYPSDFDGDVNALPVTDNPSIEGGAYITAPDYAKLLQMHLNDGACGERRALSAEGARRMRTDRLASYGGKAVSPSSIAYGDGYGLGWWTFSAEGYVIDPGAYGAVGWVSEARDYAAIIITEAGYVAGGELALAAKTALER